MCVSTVVFCTLASLAASENNPYLLPIPQENPETENIATAIAIAPIVIPNNISLPEAHIVESASLQPETVAVNLVSEASQVQAIALPETLNQTESSSSSATAPMQQPADLSDAVADVPPTFDTTPNAEPDWVALRAIANESAPRADHPPLFSPHSASETTTLLAQTAEIPTEAEVRELQEELQNVSNSGEQGEPEFGDVYEGSPAITLAVPSGYGADNFEGFANFSYQSRTRYSNEDDGTMGIGIGFGDAQEAVGFQLSYTLASFGSNRDFGTGGFNAKLHRQFSGGWSVAVGWEGFLSTGDDNDFEDSVYGTVTHIARLSPELDDPFSRIALTAGVGTGRFRTEEDVLDDNDTVGVFGSAAVRIVRPVSAILEWTGQDLAVGLSIAPFRDFPLVITPALRDIAGAGDGTRFVLGAGISWQF
jgi:hypothetical protein